MGSTSAGTCISRSSGFASRMQRAEKASEKTAPAMAVVDTCFSSRA